MMAKDVAGAPAKPSLISRLSEYLKGVKTELKRVVWPSRKEVINSLIIVGVTLIFFALFAFAIDAVASGVIGKLLEIAAQ